MASEEHKDDFKDPFHNTSSQKNSTGTDTSPPSARQNDSGFSSCPELDESADSPKELPDNESGDPCTESHCQDLTEELTKLEENDGEPESAALKSSVRLHR